MENTGKVLFEDETPQWYIAMGERWVGPLSAADVYHKILSAEITWAHFVWKAGQADWKRICDVKTFQAAVPTLPAKAVQQEVKEASRPEVKKAAGPARKAAPPSPRKTVPAEPRIWFLHYNDSQFGPFSTEEITRFLRVGKIHGRVHAWKDGMADWARLEAIPQFDDDVAASKKAREARRSGVPAPALKSTEKQDKRGAPRRPVVAKILLANREQASGAQVSVGVCRDISVGGMQVLTDQIPGQPGTHIKLNVSPAGRLGQSAKASKADAEGEIEPFVAEGVIVRILEDGRGFSFRFDKLPDNSRKAIERYIEAWVQ